VTPSRRCCGRPRACVSSPTRCASRATECISRRSRSCCAAWGTACRPTARRSRGPSTPTATPSSATSTPPSSCSSAWASRSSASTPRRRSSSATSKNGGREWRPKGEPELVRTHDFKDKQLGKAIPYGIYDLADDTGWVNVGIDHDTAQFAVASIRSWWEHLGSRRYPDATTLTITADCGGSNGNRTRLWKTELQRLANLTGLAIQVCHFPPGTSKWNKIEHRLFSFISRNWRAKPLTSIEVIVSLIAATTSRTGLEVYARLDDGVYPDKQKVPDTELAAINITRDPFHPEWNYTIKPRT